MRCADDPHFQLWLDSFEFEVEMLFATPAYIYKNIIPQDEANAIARAADLAFVGRWGEAERIRALANYNGLGILDDGAVAAESEEARRNFRKALDS